MSALKAPEDIVVDVVIDNYNYARFVGSAIQSALNQTHGNVNVIVVDDGSTDGSRAVLGRYARLVDLVLKENGGQASALNAGFARSRGDIVVFLDADDLLDPRAAALLARAFASDPRVVKVQSRMEVIDAEGRRTGTFKPAAHLPLPHGDLRRAGLAFPFDLVWLRSGGMAYRADTLRRIMPVPEVEFATCPDWYLVHLIPLLGWIASIDEVGAYYRVHGGNAYEPQDSTLDLEHLRETIGYTAVTRQALAALAKELGLVPPRGEILSVSDVANRLVSLKLEPARHPIPGDTALGLAAVGVRAARRRFDVAYLMRLLFSAWFVAMAAAPRRPAVWFAELFLFPERRMGVNRLLGRLHLSRVRAGGVGT